MLAPFGGGDIGIGGQDGVDGFLDVGSQGVVGRLCRTLEVGHSAAAGAARAELGDLGGYVGSSTTGVSTSGVSTSSVSTSGVSTSEVSTSGVSASGVSASGVSASGVSAIDASVKSGGIC